MKLIKTNNAEKWNAFAKSRKFSFLQSWQWGQIYQQETGLKAHYFKILHQKYRLGQILFLEKKLFFDKKYWYAPRAQFIPELTAEKIKQQIKENHKPVFIRLESNQKPTGSDIEPAKSIQPKTEWVLDLGKNENELLADMKPKTRYNIRLAQRKGVEIVAGQTEDDFATFYNLISQTADRQEFGLHSWEHYQKIWEIGRANRSVRIFLAKRQGKVLSAIMTSFFGDEAYYLHGGSDYEARKFMSPFILHWEVIKIAKRDGFKKYNFGGVDSVRWPGLTRFKRGFGGQEVVHPGAVDIIYQPNWYSFYRLVKKLKL